MNSILDRPDEMSEIDGQGFIRQIMGFPEHLSSALCSEVEVDFQGESVCLFGMGGSAISGDILADCVTRETHSHMSVVRGVELPGWVDRDTLVVAVSYSGNTREVLEVVDQALERGLNTVAVSSGGRLLDTCISRGVPYALVPTGFQPRAALGYILGSTACVLERAGIIPVASQLTRLVDPLKGFQGMLRPEMGSENNVAKGIALSLEGTVPVIYAPSELRSAALRWHTQINENAKMMAFTGEVPECNHNHIVGWMESRGTDRLRPVFLRSKTDNPWVAEVMAVTVEALEEGGKSPIVLELEEETRLHNLMEAIMLGDFASYYLAMLNRVDPLPVQSIQALKGRLEKSRRD